MIDGQSSGSSNDFVVGVIVLLVGQAFGSLSYIFEEKFLSEYDDLHPLIVVGWEGIWGSIILFVMLLVFQFIPCSSTTLCSGDVIENSMSALQELGTSTP